MKLEVILEKQKGKGYDYPFKFSLLSSSGMVGVKYKYCNDIIRRLELDPKEYLMKITEYKGKLFGADKTAFFKRKEHALEFVNGYLMPYLVAARLRGNTSSERRFR